MFPVFSLVLDQDVKPEMAILYPELYKDLTKVRPQPVSSSENTQALAFVYSSKIETASVLDSIRNVWHVASIRKHFEVSFLENNFQLSVIVM